VEYHLQRLCGSEYSSVAAIPCIVRSLTHFVMSSSVIIQPRALHSPGVWVLLFPTSCTPFSQRQLYVATSNIVVTMVTRLVKWNMFPHRSAIWAKSMKLDNKECKNILNFSMAHLSFMALHFYALYAKQFRKAISSSAMFFYLLRIVREILYWGDF
jgi:hypothetical protein